MSILRMDAFTNGEKDLDDLMILFISFSMCVCFLAELPVNSSDVAVPVQATQTT